MPSVMTLYTTALNGTMTINDNIKTEKMTLKQYRIEFASDAEAKAAVALSFSTKWLNSGRLVAGSNGANLFDQKSIYLPVNDLEVTLCNPDYTFNVSDLISSTFSYNITGIATTGFTSLMMVFEYDSEFDLVK